MPGLAASWLLGEDLAYRFAGAMHARNVLVRLVFIVPVQVDPGRRNPSLLGSDLSPGISAGRAGAVGFSGDR